jgi:hypothetical protein
LPAAPPVHYTGRAVPSHPFCNEIPKVYLGVFSGEQPKAAKAWKCFPSRCSLSMSMECKFCQGTFSCPWRVCPRTAIKGTQLTLSVAPLRKDNTETRSDTLDPSGQRSPFIWDQFRQHTVGTTDSISITDQGQLELKFHI